MLRPGWPHEESEHEALRLSIWDGAGAVRLLAHEPWVLLLERLDPARGLRDEPLDSAVEVLANLIRRLDRAAPPAVRTLRERAARWARDLHGENVAAGRCRRCSSRPPCGTAASSALWPATGW